MHKPENALITVVIRPCHLIWQSVQSLYHYSAINGNMLNCDKKSCITVRVSILRNIYRSFIFYIPGSLFYVYAILMQI